MPNAEVHRGNRRRPRRSAGMSLLNPTVGHLFDLGAVNAELWVLTDDMRTLAEQHRSVTTPDSSGLTGQFSGPRVLEQAGPVGIAILRLNDRRAELIQTINELCGDADGREKL